MNASALITGGGKRIGRAIALGLAKKGYDIALHYNTSGGEAKTLAGEIESASRRVGLFQADLGDMKQVAALAERVFDAFADLSVLVNNAAIFERAGLAETDEDIFERHFNINFKAPFFLSREFARRCRKGHIINLLDAKITDNVTSYFAYMLSKKALMSFTEMAAKALAGRIQVNGVAPGLVLPTEGEIAEGQTGNEQDVVDAVIRLLENDCITGQCVFVAGG